MYCYRIFFYFVTGPCTDADRQSYDGKLGRAIGNCSDTYCVCDDTNTWSVQTCDGEGRVFNTETGACDDNVNVEACDGKDAMKI